MHRSHAVRARAHERDRERAARDARRRRAHDRAAGLRIRRRPGRRRASPTPASAWTRSRLADLRAVLLDEGDRHRARADDREAQRRADGRNDRGEQREGVGTTVTITLWRRRRCDVGGPPAVGRPIANPTDQTRDRCTPPTINTTRGCVQMAAMPAAIRMSTRNDRPLLRSSFLKLRKRIVLTISTAGTSTIASAGSAARDSPAVRTDTQTRWPPGSPRRGGLGIPTK